MKARVLFFLLFVLGFSLLAPQRVFAEDYKYKLSSTVTIGEDFITTVKTIVDGDSTGGSAVPTSLLLPAIGTNPKGVTAKFADGKQVQTQVIGNSVSLQLSPFKSNSGKDWSLSYTYTTSLGINMGKSHLVMFPAGNYGDVAISSESISVVSSIDLGPFVLRGLAPNKTTAVAGDTVSTWSSSDGQLKEAFGMLYGDSALATISLKTTLQNDGYWWQTKSVTLPADTNQQKVIIDSISPEPTKVGLDVDGNIIIEYRIAPRQKIDVTATARAIISSYTYSLDDAEPLNTIPPQISELYTQTNETWADTDIAVETGQLEPVPEMVEKIYNSLATELKKVESIPDQYAFSLSASNRLVGELRAQKIPARVVLGKVFGDGAFVFSASQDHAWVEAYIPAVGWITLDPVFETRANYFGVADVQRIAVSIRGEKPDFPPDMLSSFSVAFLDEDAPALPQPSPNITSVKYMILPGLALQTTKVAMPAGITVDNLALAIGSDAEMQLGSLAPYQSISIRSLSLAGGAFSSELVKAGIVGTSGTLADGTVAKEVTTTVNYLPLLILVIISIGGFAAKIIFAKLHNGSSRAANPTKKEKAAKETLVIATDAAGHKIEDDDLLSSPSTHEYDDSKEPEDAVISLAKPSESPTQEAIVEENAQPHQIQRPLPKSPHMTVLTAPLPKKLPIQPKISGTMPVSKAVTVTPQEIRKVVKRKRPPLVQ